MGRHVKNRHTAETDRSYPALPDVIGKAPERNDARRLPRYRMVTMTEAFRRLL